MKIAQVIDTLSVGGAERVCLDITNLLIKYDQDVNLILLKSGGPLSQNINKKYVKRVKNSNKFNIFFGSNYI